MASARARSIALTPIGDRSLVDRGSLPSYLAVLGAVLFVASAALLGPFDWNGADFEAVIAAFGLMIGVAVAIRWLGSPAIAAGIETCALIMASTIIAPVCAVVAASSALPLADQMLARADAWLFFGFDRTVMMAGLAGNTTFFDLVRPIYHSLLPQPFLIALLLCFTGQRQRAWALVLAWAFALVLSVAIFPFFPAYGTPPYSYEFIDILAGTRDGSLRMLDQSTLTGIITFPSFHAAGAVVLGWAGSKIRLVGPAFVVLNVLMFASALVGGGHYLVDLVAGGLIGVAAIMMAQATQRRVDS